MATKVSWLFNGNSAGSGKVWGFSETWWTNLAGDPLITAMDLVSSRRVQILSTNTAIVGYRIGQDNGRSFVKRKFFAPPTANATSNLPVDCALCQVAVANATTRKKFFLHDLPDDWVRTTVIDPIRIPAINLVTQTLVAAGFMVRFQLQTAASAPILSVDTTGNVVTAAPIALVVGNKINFLSCRDINNRVVRGTFYIETVTDGSHFKVAHWTGQVVGARGRVRLASFSFGASVYLGDDTVIGAAPRKVGRPFFQSRGRVPVRR